MADIIGYGDIAADALSLINGTGRQVTFNRFDQTPANSGKPWEGPADPSASPDATASVFAAFVPPSDADSLGLSGIDQDLLKRTEQICIVAPGTVNPPFDLGTANECSDGSVKWKVTFTETLAPGDIVLLYFIGVSR